ncbi:MAG: WecB/TagA/CpsF family glycosyltransferase [Candidatus Dormibacteraeota bacterium]|uniref:WecB/TagA/CpsF family glycosyltransferase n=1 Tax=Candidatus Aeolococcus gillhamiae TaxID=3127015 RepID=A0A934JXQ2_9BACT|nr:WecB/TagA/CpsF family glycosyltransferase [Candidatus Dormibacteraeota bacterium]
MPLTTRTRVLGCPVDVVDMGTAVERLLELLASAGGQPALVVTLNPEILMRARREPSFGALLESAALIVPDGVGLVRALRRRGFRRAERVGGADLLEAYLPHARSLGHRVALVGAGPGVAERAAEVLRRRHPGLDVVADGGDPTAATAARVGATEPAVVAAAYGAGRQERFLRDHLEGMHGHVGIGVGGTLDYLAGTARRAPALVRQAGLEWLWRLAHEPSRWRRQLALPRFWFLERREARR